MPTTADTPRRPTITLPPRPSLETFLSSAGIISPGPMTLVSSFFADDYCSSLSASPSHSPSFSQLLAAANTDSSSSPFFTVPPGFSPSDFLFSPHPQSPFGISHQQALAQVTAQAVVSQLQGEMQIEEEASNDDASEKKVAVAVSVSVSDNKKLFQQPCDDGYNWRKYGQKQVKGSEFPRSYYKCTNLSCLVKKKVERACDGHITEIIYKGQHNHEKPLPNNKRNNNKNSIDYSNELKSDSFGKSFSDCSSSMMDHCESYDLGALDMREEEGGDDDIVEPNPKRRNIGVGVSEVHKTTVTEPKIIVQTRSEVDLLDDGYKWRKYGQKVVKGNPHPRSYYKCTSAGCNVRKHVERASMDPKAVITTYEGKHNHDVPSSGKSSHNTSSNSKLHNKMVLPEKLPVAGDLDYGNSNQRPIHLRLKEEHIIA